MNVRGWLLRLLGMNRELERSLAKEADFWSDRLAALDPETRTRLHAKYGSPSVMTTKWRRPRSLIKRDARSEADAP